MGRRLIYDEAMTSGIQTTEHQIRKILEYLQGNGLITYQNKRKGADLTLKGKELILEYIKLN